MEEFYRLKDRKGNEEPQNIVRTVLGGKLKKIVLKGEIMIPEPDRQELPQLENLDIVETDSRVEPGLHLQTIHITFLSNIFFCF